jgi:hypothetical protein
VKTPVKICLFLDNQREKMDLPGKDLEYTEIYRMIYRRVIREAKTRENDRYINGW